MLLKALNFNFVGLRPPGVAYGFGLLKGGRAFYLIFWWPNNPEVIGNIFRSLDEGRYPLPLCPPTALRGPQLYPLKKSVKTRHVHNQEGVDHKILVNDQSVDTGGGFTLGCLWMCMAFQLFHQLTLLYSPPLPNESQ